MTEDHKMHVFDEAQEKPQPHHHHPETQRAGWVLTPPQYQKAQSEKEQVDHTAELEELRQKVNSLTHENMLLTKANQTLKSQVPVKKPVGRPRKEKQDELETD